jgi:hypothetical protein
MNKKYGVQLTDQERAELAAVIKKFEGASQKVRRAQIDTLQVPARAREPEESSFPLRGFHAASLRLGDCDHGRVQRTALE